jgi:hypothetical protein
MITDSGKVLDPTTPNQHHRVLLEIMADSGNISGYFSTVRKAYTSNLSQS